MRVGIIGAGLAGLACAAALSEAGYAVRLFDKGRGPGGRMSTRRIDTAHGTASFDHGAQCMAATTEEFRLALNAWEARGVVARWPEAGDNAWVGVPGMNALVSDLARRQQVTFNCLIKGVVRIGSEWQLVTEHERIGPFDKLVVATPAEQAAPLLSLADFAMARAATAAISQPCWTVMLAFAERPSLTREVLRHVGPFAWVTRNSSKPGRQGPDAWVAQANAVWSRAHLEASGDDILQALLCEFAALARGPLPELAAASAHRWRFARPAGQAQTALWNQHLGIGACGDWLIESTVEAAWRSGQALADTIARGDAGSVAAE